MLSLPGHTRRDQASEEGSRAQGARSLPQPHLLHVGDGRSPAPGDSLRHDGVLDAEQVLGARSLLRRVHEADHRARPHEKTRLAGHLPRRPRAGEGGDREIQGGGRGEAGGGIGRHLRAAHRPGERLHIQGLQRDHPREQHRPLVLARGQAHGQPRERVFERLDQGGALHGLRALRQAGLGGGAGGRRLHRVVQREATLLVSRVHDAERLLRRLHGGGGGEARHVRGSRDRPDAEVRAREARKGRGRCRKQRDRHKRAPLLRCRCLRPSKRKTAPVSTNAMRIPALVSTIATGKMEKVSTKLD